MSGGSFDYLCAAEDPGQHPRIAEMADELDALQGRFNPPYLKRAAARAADETRAIAAAGVARLFATAREPAIVSLWQTIEWWRSNDYGIEDVEDALTRYASTGRPRAEAARPSFGEPCPIHGQTKERLDAAEAARDRYRQALEQIAAGDFPMGTVAGDMQAVAAAALEGES